MLNLIIFSATAAFAQEPESSTSWGMSGFDTQETRVMVGLAGEFWSDPSIIKSTSRLSFL